MSLGERFARLPRPISWRLFPGLRYLNLMRTLELRLMAPYVGHVEGWRVLDVGCGHGLYSMDLARRGAIMVGCDLQRPSLLLCPLAAWSDNRQDVQGHGLVIIARKEANHSG